MARSPVTQTSGLHGRPQGTRIHRPAWTAGLLGIGRVRQPGAETCWQADRIAYGHCG